MVKYGNTIANLACAIMRHFGVKDVENPSLPVAEQLLKQYPHRNVVVLLLDSLGVYNMREHLSEEGFFLRHMAEEYHSVYPPTTVAATTSVNSGLYPNQHAWLGWVCYFTEVDQNVIVFLNEDNDTGNSLDQPKLADTLRPYRTVVERIREAGYKAHVVSPFSEDNKVDTFEQLADQLQRLTKEEGAKYIYAYWPEPDHSMHLKGCHHQKVGLLMQSLEKQVKQLSETLSDTLLLVTADHGHVDAQGKVITDYPQIMDCLVRMPSIEARTVNFFTKPGQEAVFRQAFQEAFGEHFTLYTREEALSCHLFGEGKDHPMLSSMLGDFIAIARDETTIFNRAEQMCVLKGVHAGGTIQEILIPLIAISRPLP